MRRSLPLVCLAALLCACAGVQRYDGGIVFIPEPTGDPVEQQVERLFRDRTGIWMQMPKGVALDVLAERHQLEYGRTPTSGGVSTFRMPGGGGYVYLMEYKGPPGSGKTFVCGLQLRGVGDNPPPLISPSEVRSAIGGQSYRRTQLRVISVTDREIVFLDREHCGRRDPGPPDSAP